MNIKTSFLFLFATTAFVGSVLAQDQGKPEKKPVDLTLLPPASTRTGLTYETDIKPLLGNTCFGCHGAEKQRGKIRLDNLEAVLKGGEDGKIVTPGDSAHSSLVISIARIDPESAMPPMRKGRGPGGPKPPAPSASPDAGTPPAVAPPAPGKMPKFLTPEEVGIVRAWIDQGAK